MKKTTKKTSKKTPTLELNADDWVTIASLCQEVNDQRKDAAISAYLDDTRHSQFLLAETFKYAVINKIKGLKTGVIEPHLEICCCKGTFASIMSEKPSVEYVGCSRIQDADEIEDGATRADDRVNKVTFEDMTVEEKCAFLTDDSEYCLSNFCVCYVPDEKRQLGYLEAVREYLLTGAAIAKGIGSGAAEMFMDAYRMLRRRVIVHEDCRVKKPSWEVGTGLSVEQAEAAYEMAEKAQGKLWVDIELAKVKPIRVSHKRTTTKRS